MVTPPKCKHCPHIAAMHREGGKGTCRYVGCKCKGDATFVLKVTKVKVNDGIEALVFGFEEAAPDNDTLDLSVKLPKNANPHAVVSREFKRLTKKRKKS